LFSASLAAVPDAEREMLACETASANRSACNDRINHNLPAAGLEHCGRRRWRIDYKYSSNDRHFGSAGGEDVTEGGKVSASTKRGTTLRELRAV
jgi:hypothetical protein